MPYITIFCVTLGLESSNKMYSIRLLGVIMTGCIYLVMEIVTEIST